MVNWAELGRHLEIPENWWNQRVEDGKSKSLSQDYGNHNCQPTMLFDLDCGTE